MSRSRRNFTAFDDLILGYIETYWRDFFIPPSINDICEYCSEKTGRNTSKAAVSYSLRKLEEFEMIKLVKGKSVPVQVHEVLSDFYKEEKGELHDYDREVDWTAKNLSHDANPDQENGQYPLFPADS